MDPQQPFLLLLRLLFALYVCMDGCIYVCRIIIITVNKGENGPNKVVMLAII